MTAVDKKISFANRTPTADTSIREDGELRLLSTVIKRVKLSANSDFRTRRGDGSWAPFAASSLTLIHVELPLAKEYLICNQTNGSFSSELASCLPWWLIRLEESGHFIIIFDSKGLSLFTFHLKNNLYWWRPNCVPVMSPCLKLLQPMTDLVILKCPIKGEIYLPFALCDNKSSCIMTLLLNCAGGRKQ